MLEMLIRWVVVYHARWQWSYPVIMNRTSRKKTWVKEVQTHNFYVEVRWILNTHLKDEKEDSARLPPASSYLCCWQYSNHYHTVWKGQFRTALTCIILMILWVKENIEAWADIPNPSPRLQVHISQHKIKACFLTGKKTWSLSMKTCRHNWLKNKDQTICFLFFFFFLIKQYHFKTLAQIK